MDDQAFKSLITRLEADAERDPRAYLTNALGVTLLGFGVLALAILFALVPALLLTGLVVAVFVTGGKALIVLAKLGKLLVLLVLPGWVMIRASVKMLFSRFPAPEGRPLTAREAPALHAQIGELRRRMHGPRIHHVLLTEDLNAAIVQHPRFGLFGWESNYLVLGLPLLQTLSEDEALSVVAHEYGHLSGHHSRVGGFIYRMRSAWGRMQEISAQWNDWGSRLIARLFRWYAPYFNAYTFVLARRNEYFADRAAVELVGPRNAANALMRVNLAAQLESEVYWPAIDRLAGNVPEPLESRYGYWSDTLRERLDDATRLRYLEAAARRETDHLDTHPCLRDRLRAMGMSADATAAGSLGTPAASAAEIWLGASLASIRAEFDRAWRERTAERWHQRHAQVAAQRERLAELRAQDRNSADLRWEYINLVGEVEPDHDLLPLVEELLEQMPQHLPALYRRGILRLDKGDADGIADLEQVMRQDAYATLPACEAAWRYWLDRDPEKAEHYRARWLERSRLEQELSVEQQSLPRDARLETHDLDATTEHAIRALVQTESKYLRCAYLLRRVFKADPSRHDYVLAFETKAFTFGNKAPGVIQRLANLEFPVSAFIVHLGSNTYRPIKKRIKQLGLQPLYGKK
ncbi:MAG: M48 family metallopeptidase [Rhodocyclaceae bacterium]|nr:M48 family metallopeptidase [Rhodocyclaceae bacterium]